MISPLEPAPPTADAIGAATVSAGRPYDRCTLGAADCESDGDRKADCSMAGSIAASSKLVSV